ncbi:hypothetical protein F5I97DRAFT_1020630 [Phlebopus sp. FC_14]|nr:hypothetical protein F5I97DRAFT_1020630 [Phlebopus sp. FC_14]
MFFNIHISNSRQIHLHDTLIYWLIPRQQSLLASVHAGLSSTAQPLSGGPLRSPNTHTDTASGLLPLFIHHSKHYWAAYVHVTNLVNATVVPFSALLHVLLALLLEKHSSGYRSLIVDDTRVHETTDATHVGSFSYLSIRTHSAPRHSKILLIPSSPPPVPVLIGPQPAPHRIYNHSLALHVPLLCSIVPTSARKPNAVQLRRSCALYFDEPQSHRTWNGVARAGMHNEVYPGSTPELRVLLSFMYAPTRASSEPARAGPFYTTCNYIYMNDIWSAHCIQDATTTYLRYTHTTYICTVPVVSFWQKQLCTW